MSSAIGEWLTQNSVDGKQLTLSSAGKQTPISSGVGEQLTLSNAGCEQTTLKGSLLLRKQCPSRSVNFTDPSSSAGLAGQLDVHFLDATFHAAPMLRLQSPM
ncbi:Hypothetical predicted protein [Octopus vulgaris]|uniref:Uncharacterized protein n=1 Tax=Octopus vulgaris TaxID=6645 RepID=A0AA36BFZ3_OCTVU|nr:Hypothetical predicted protein [Octopus vulgaris]